MNGKYTEKPSKAEWAEKYNVKILDSVTANIEKGSVSVWSEEMLRICKGGQECA